MAASLVQSTRVGSCISQLSRCALLGRFRQHQPVIACTSSNLTLRTPSLPPSCQIHTLRLPSTVQTHGATLLGSRQTPFVSSSRALSSDAESRDLMDFPRVVFPSVVKTLRRWFLVNFVIRPYLDHGFTMQTFMEGAKEAIVLLSERLSLGDLAGLRGLVTPEALAEIERNFTHLSVKERAELRVQPEMIGPFMPCEVGMIIVEDGDVQKRWVEITVCAHVHPAFARSDVTVSQMQAEDLTVCNYRFIRDYTRGERDSWTVNLVNHFKPFRKGGS